MVATYRDSDAIDYPKERFVHHQAGDGGYGGSSYIDLLAFREKDANTAWTSASDGTLEERLYYCQNQHADVVALITAAGTQREMVRYSAYGVPLGLPVGDVDSDGDCDLTDQNQVRDWWLAPAYDVRGDLDLDGDVDQYDRDTLRDYFKGVTLGRGVLSAPLVASQRGVAGYLSASVDPTLYLLRHRPFPSVLGSWAGRDLMAYFDGFSLVEMVKSNPVVLVDPLGLFGGGLGLHEEELNVAMRNPIDAFRARNTHHETDGAINILELLKLAPWANSDESNTVRHCVWSCLMCETSNEEFATEMANAHEVGSRQNFKDNMRTVVKSRSGRFGRSYHVYYNEWKGKTRISQPSTWLRPGRDKAGHLIGETDMGSDLHNNFEGRKCCKMQGTDGGYGFGPNGGLEHGSGGSCVECCLDKFRRKLLSVWHSSAPAAEIVHD